MAIATQTPPAIHTAFNPVILKISATEQEDIDAGHTIAINKRINELAIDENINVALFGEFFNHVVRFELSEILKNWFSDKITVLTQCSYCYLDEKLAFMYQIVPNDLSFNNSTHIAVNAVVQLQRNPDITAWGNRFLTNMPVLRKYEGYPLDISYLNNSQKAFVSFSGNTLNRYESIPKRHFSISIPDGISSVIISDIPLTVDLLTNSDKQILTNDSKNIVVRNPIKASIQVSEELLPSCIPGSPFYVRWINQLGGFDYWMFYLNQIYEQSVNTLTAASPVIDDIMNANYIEYEVNKETEKTITVGAGNLIELEYNELLKISTSPLVEVWDMEVQKWYRVYVDSGKFENSTRNRRKEIEIEFTLPVPQIQF
ncbi:MAG: hypothetical protein FWF52_01195 [Candidatus Azobacteroides sp.]|nr:hypothetical protein [Candidatus Azobacteroides sp.]